MALSQKQWAQIGQSFASAGYGFAGGRNPLAASLMETHAAQIQQSVLDEERRKREKAKRGRKWGKVGSVVGGTVGFAVGGPIGAGIGASIGGAGGEKLATGHSGRFAGDVMGYGVPATIGAYGARAVAPKAVPGTAGAGAGAPYAAVTPGGPPRIGPGGVALLPPTAATPGYTPPRPTPAPGYRERVKGRWSELGGMRGALSEAYPAATDQPPVYYVYENGQLRRV